MMHAVVSLIVMLSAAQQPARDRPRPSASGTAVIAGVITTGQRPVRPVRRARVMLSSPDHHYARTVVTEDDGTFRFDRLPAGRYSLSASKAAYLPISYGARRTGRPGTVLALRPGDSLSLPIHMDRGGVISGAVQDPDGQPAAGVTVEVLSESHIGAMRRLTRITSAPASTDDRGEYRIFGLAPGQYFVSARPPRALADVQVLSDREIRRALAEARQPGMQTRPGPERPRSTRLLPSEPRRRVGFTPVFYPGTPVVARARPISIGHEEERHGIDFQLEHVPIATVQGTVTAPPGPQRFTMVTLSPKRALDGPTPSVPLTSARVGSGGAFTFVSVAPGEYTVQARVMPAGGRTVPVDPDAPTWASTDIIVNGEDVTGVPLVLERPLRISGRVAFDGPSPLGLIAPLELLLPVQAMDNRAALAAPRLQIEPDGRFTISGILPGLYAPADMRGVRSPVGRWWLKSIVANGRDLLDHPLDLERSVTDAVITLADRASEITGTLRDRAGHPLPHSHVVVFSVDRKSWFYYSPRVVAAQTSGEGRYRVMNLPPGEYLVASGADLLAGEWWDPTVLERLAAGATRIRLDGFGQVTVDVTAVLSSAF